MKFFFEVYGVVISIIIFWMIVVLGIDYLIDYFHDKDNDEYNVGE